MMMEAIKLYREKFEPSEQLAEPYVMLGFNAIVAETDVASRFPAFPRTR
jgi:alkanesulfonate monooxygenase SsuD/methylene tetrahydromethanopterin reductase-like flavin-dependent oxidoreductase (luciferase family)